MHVLATWSFFLPSLRWRHNDHAGVSNHQPHGCLLNRLFRRKSKKTSKLHVTGLCAGNSPGTGEFPAQMASYAENVSIWWRHHDSSRLLVFSPLGSSLNYVTTNVIGWPLDISWSDVSDLYLLQPVHTENVLYILVPVTKYTIILKYKYS